MLRRNSVQALFNGYYHDNNIENINKDGTGSKNSGKQQTGKTGSAAASGPKEDDFSSIPESSSQAEYSAGSSTVAMK